MAVAFRNLGLHNKVVVISILRSQKEVSWIVGMTKLKALPFLPTGVFHSSPSGLCQQSQNTCSLHWSSVPTFV
jgi:hypothetical protein